MAIAIPDVPRRLRRTLLYPFVASGRAALSALPAPAASRLADLAAGLAFRLLPRERQRMAEHLALAFPEKSAADRTAIAEAAFRHFAQVFVETARLTRLSDGALADLVRVEDPGGVLDRLTRERSGGLAVTAHLGNWELLAAVCARRGVPVQVVATRFRDPRVNDLLVELRAASGIRTIQRDEGPRPILRALREGHVLGILIDQDTDVDGCFVPFFGRPAYTTRGPGVLHLATGATVFTLFCTRQPDGRYLLEVEPPLPPAPPGLTGPARAAAAEAIVAECTRRIEAAVRRHPEQWVWWHQRWKTTPEGHRSRPDPGRVST
ncbi:MAG TPA: lysophospholipid acyltransferase family protein [Thermodesulfobacteriota bacterium]